MSSQAIQGGPGELEHEASVDEVLEQIKLLELPLDVLFNILSNLHPLDRISKPFLALLHSRKSASIWQIARRRLTVYAPKSFPNPVDSPISRTPRFYAFDAPARKRTTYSGIHVFEDEEADAEEDTKSHVALAVPDPPAGLAEFALARYLYVTKCDNCASPLASEWIVTSHCIPSCLRHLCSHCDHSQNEGFRAVLDRFESALSPATLASMPLYNEFLTTRPYWNAYSDMNVSQPPECYLPTRLRFIANADLEKEFKLFSERKQTLQPFEYQEWYLRITSTHLARRLDGAKISEYAWLHSTYVKYKERIDASIEARNQYDFVNGVSDRLKKLSEFPAKAIAYVVDPASFKWAAEYIVPWRHDPDATWEAVSSRFLDLLKAYEEWARRHPSQLSVFTTSTIRDVLLNLAKDIPTGHWISCERMEDLVNGLLAFDLPSIRAIVTQDFWNREIMGSEASIRKSMQIHRNEICQELASLSNSIITDLVRKHTEENAVHTPGIGDRMEYLERIDTCFSCAVCHSSGLGYRGVLEHECFAAHLGHTSFRNQCNNEPFLQMCRIIGWQPQRVLVDNTTAQVLRILASAAGDFFNTTHVDDENEFPKTHRDREDCTLLWVFICDWPNCQQKDSLPICGLEESIKHFVDHMNLDGATLEELFGEHAPKLAHAPEKDDDTDDDEGEEHFDDIPEEFYDYSSNPDVLDDDA